MTQEARDDRLLGVLFLTACTSIYRLPTKTCAAWLPQHASQSDASSGRPWYGPLRWMHFPRS